MALELLLGKHAAKTSAFRRSTWYLGATNVARCNMQLTDDLKAGLQLIFAQL